MASNITAPFALYAVHVVLLCVACAPTRTGSFTPAGYKNTVYEYQVTASENGQLLPESWKLDNYYRDKSNELRPKDADLYVTKLDFDFDGDGKYDTSSEEFVYDLRFKHLVHDGVIFLRTIPVSSDLQQKKLEVLMDRYVEQVAGAGYELVNLSPSSSVVVEKRYAAAVADRAQAKLAGRDAYVATLDVANIDQIRLDPNARKERVQLVLMHTEFEYKATNPTKHTSRTFPVVMFAGYANQPKEFAAGLQDFHALLSRIVINTQRGFVLQEPTDALVSATSRPTSTESAPEPSADHPAQNVP